MTLEIRRPGPVVPGLGRLKRRLMLEQPSENADGAGGLTRSFVTVATLWANLEWLAGEERWRQDRPEQAGLYRVTLRWRSGLTAGMRFRDGTRIFEIRSAGDPDGARRSLVCLTEEITS
jgi:SPP1 family predicted phage head-tail adaptor